MQTVKRTCTVKPNKESVTVLTNNIWSSTCVMQAPPLFPSERGLFVNNRVERGEQEYRNNRFNALLPINAPF